MLTSSIMYAADDKECQFSIKLEYDAYKDSIIASHILTMPAYTRYIFVVKHLSSRQITSKGEIRPHDDPQNFTRYTPPDDLIRCLIKRIDNCEIELAKNTPYDDDANGLTYVSYDCLTNAVIVTHESSTSTYSRRIQGSKNLDEPAMKAKGTIIFHDRKEQQIAYEPSQQIIDKLQNRVKDYLKPYTIITDKHGKTAQLFLEYICHKDQVIDATLLIHVPRFSTKKMSLCYQTGKEISPFSAIKICKGHFADRIVEELENALSSKEHEELRNRIKQEYVCNGSILMDYTPSNEEKGRLNDTLIQYLRPIKIKKQDLEAKLEHYLTCYMANVVDDEDLNTEEKQDESLHRVRSLIESYTQIDKGTKILFKGSGDWETYTSKDNVEEPVLVSYDYSMT